MLGGAALDGVGHDLLGPDRRRFPRFGLETFDEVGGIPPRLALQLTQQQLPRLFGRQPGDALELALSFPEQLFAFRETDRQCFFPSGQNAFAAAEAYIQSSRYEAFSRTVMEAWLAGTPVLANGGSDVVRWHCERSGAGLVWDDEAEFAECLRLVAEAPDLARRLAKGGRDYVLENYTWDRVLDGVEKGLATWTKP